ncbi:MAG: acyl-CoA dehydrogenase [Thermoanaerobaculia bacterium]
MLLNPKQGVREYPDEASREMMLAVIEFFESKGLARIKHDDHERVWYQDFLEFVKSKELFSTFLTPPEYGDEGCRWDTWRNCELNEILGFYGLAYWYTWQVTILGLGPVWMSGNEEVKRKTARFLKEGGIFAFGLSEQEHGADLYSSEMMLYPQKDGSFLARGEKYYIGNGNEAALVSVFGKVADSEDYVFFIADPRHEQYECVKNVCNSQNYVAHIALHDYPITEADILSRGREAWDTSLNTVNVGKFNLGWASIGICTHAFYEAIDHASSRRLFNHSVTDFPHIRQFFTDAYCRLVAMKLFALRGSDYLRTASPDDRRYLLYDPLVKMKVTSQGEEVIDLLWDIIAAKGFEKDLYFEMAARDIRALPKLEGTVHVNMALVIKFMKNYFFEPSEFPEIPEVKEPRHDAFLFDQGPTKGLGKIRFHDYREVYERVDLPNVRIFKKQIRTFRHLLMVARPNKEQIKDIDFLLIVGELFTLVVYGQLILENAPVHSVEDDVLDQIFDVLVRDFSKFSLQLYSKTSSTTTQRLFCRRMIRKPVVDHARFERVWEDHVYALDGAYRMNE